MLETVIIQITGISIFVCLKHQEDVHPHAKTLENGNLSGSGNFFISLFDLISFIQTGKKTNFYPSILGNTGMTSTASGDKVYNLLQIITRERVNSKN